MAKYEKKITGNFDTVLRDINDGILNGSISASLEEKSDFRSDDIRCAVRVYERYSMLGKNRVSLNVTLLGNQDELYLSAITSGGSQAVFFKINTFGEDSFLDCIIRIVEKL